jgi:hypothetical protein
MGTKTLPTIWGTYMKLVTKYHISAIDSCWEKYLGRKDGKTDGQTDRGKTVYPHPPSGSGGIIYRQCMYIVFILQCQKDQNNCQIVWKEQKLRVVLIIFHGVGRNMIFGHKLHIGTPYRGKRFCTHQIPTSCLLTLLIFIHIEHIC